MPGRTVVITGASDGIGAAAARQLTERGEHVVLVGRSPARTAALGAEIGAPHHLADFAVLDQVEALARELADAYPRIDVLANNAGGIMGARELTGDGFEKTLQVNHLAPFLLTHRLMPTLVASAASVVQTSSEASYRFGLLDTTDLNQERAYTPEKAYGEAKLANVLFTQELHRRFHDDGIAAVAFHPGRVATSFASDTTSLMRFVYGTFLARLFLVGPEKGGRALTWLVEGTPGRTWEPGGYYENDRLVANPRAQDPDLPRELWERTEALLGLSPAG